MGDELKTAREIIESKGLDWEVKSEPIYTGIVRKDSVGVETTSYDVIQGRDAIVRQDNRSTLGIVTDRYVTIQNVEAFGFLDALVGQNQAIYENAGLFYGGRRVFLQVRLPNDIEIAANREDRIRKYLLVTNSHDGKGSLRAFYTPERIVCSNQLSGLFKSDEAKEGVSIRHTGDIGAKVSEAQRILGLSVKYYDELSEVFNYLAKKPVTTQQVRGYLETLIPDRKDAKNNTRAENIRSEIEQLFRHGKGNELPGISGTAWALVNGVSEYVTHRRSTHGETDEQKLSGRLHSAWFGPGHDLNTRAVSQVLELVK